jgi:hypothetical protein
MKAGHSSQIRKECSTALGQIYQEWDGLWLVELILLAEHLYGEQDVLTDIIASSVLNDA